MAGDGGPSPATRWLGWRVGRWPQVEEKKKIKKRREKEKEKEKKKKKKKRKREIDGRGNK